MDYIGSILTQGRSLSRSNYHFIVIVTDRFEKKAQVVYFGGIDAIARDGVFTVMSPSAFNVSRLVI